ncbi:M67 family metallopeptidase [Sphingomonas sp.]|uniref:M67 family metallopeptidase n=1 Tax=Sphingomonas sp. TaxID=28214 RepID=UPI001B1F2BA8|nr:M67 family metallopeptidase [Sphingomonas sp.]MBO9713531.1 M67 family metallopeptidase [Sphingomonas sp.]
MGYAVSRIALETIEAEARLAAPREACGLLLGTGDMIEVAEVARNVAPDPLRHFEIDPAALFAALRAERAGGRRLIGYWHSHPSGDAEPSDTDRAMAAPDGKLWLILGGGRITGWRVEAAGFVAVALTVADEA